MKKILILAVLLLTASAGLYAQKTMKAIFDKYADDERFSYVSVGKGAFNMVRSLDVLGDVTKNEKDMIANMTGLKILSLESSPNEAVYSTLLNDVQAATSADTHETLVEVREKGERTEIFVAKDKSEMIIISKDAEDLSIIWLQGTPQKK